MNYIHKDYQGSFETITNNQGTVVEKLSYDPWGRRRNPTNWTFTNVPESYKFDRGYTGHEHLDQFGLINMNGRMYDPMLGRFLSPDNYVQAPDYTQNFNRYSYVLNNPLKYTDPSGEWFFLNPNIGWSKEGGLSLGVSVGVGFSGGLSVQAGFGYNFKSSDAYVYVGASAAFNTIYATYSSRSGASVGYTVGLTQFSGFPISTNFVTAGFNYNISHNSWSANISAMQVDQNGWTFNPSVSVSYDISEHVNNLTKGQGFRTNRTVFETMISASDFTCDDIIDYFGFEGEYNSNYVVGAGAGANSETGYIGYTDDAFQNYDYFHAYALHEEFHRNEVLSGKIDKTEFQWYQKAEYRANLYTYRNQWRYLRAKNITFKNNVNSYAIQIGIKPDFHLWDFIYKIPRRF